MACEHVPLWSFSGLVAAFLDLAIAYLLLCASSLAYVASRFMGFFGLSLPCPCNVIFCKNLCLNRLLVDLPTLKITGVHHSIKHKFPFRSHARLQNHDRRNGDDNRILGVECQASCSSLSDDNSSSDDVVVWREISPLSEKKHDIKGKDSIIPRPRNRSGVRGKKSSSPSQGFSLHLEPYQLIRESPMPLHSGLGTHNYGYRHNDVSDSTSANHFPDEEEEMQKDDSVGSQSSRNLDQELEGERAALLYAELEKERSAAASAADEALAMISRLQEEKAHIDMEARQYQRIIEEKYAYDAEEISLLKDILVRREKEKHVLEKEVEGYRQLISPEDENFIEDRNEARRLACLPVDPNHDPISILRQLAASTTDQKGGAQSSSQKPEDSDERSSSCDITGGSVELQEKEMIFQSTSETREAREAEQVQETNTGSEVGEKIIETCSGGTTQCGEEEESSQRFPPIAPRRRSLHALDIEMQKIESEVGELQERLKVVRKGRVDRSRLTKLWEAGNGGVRQQSLPLLASSKTCSRKRRSRSVSLLGSSVYE